MRRTSSLAASLLAAALLVVGSGTTGNAQSPEPRAERTAAGDYVVWAVGDMCLRQETPQDCGDVGARIRADATRDAVLVLGDAQYEDGTLAEYRQWYDRKMRGLRSISHPVPGNHDYNTRNAAGYFDYWGGLAGARGAGWRAFTLGGWRLVGANSNCGYVGGCGANTAQGRFVTSQLRSAGRCEIVFAHHPPFSDGEHGDAPQGRDLFRLAYDNHAELYLAGHDHNYQRFAPRRPDGTVDNRAGVRSFVVGTGGGRLTAFEGGNRSQFRQNTTLGALRLVLRGTGYRATFVSIGGAVLDSVSGTCRA